jgi:predicted ATPase
VAPPPFVVRVRIQNYRSIRACDVSLGKLAVLVGPNGSGKSNFLDALRFTADALSTTLDNALRDRGGINEVRRRSGGHPNHFAIRVDFRLPSGSYGHYAYKVGALRPGGFSVTDEDCVVRSTELGGGESRYHLGAGGFETSVDERLPAVAKDRLFLVSASNVEPFRQIYDLLTAMGFYNLNPAVIRQPQQPDPGILLRRDGSNLASVLAHLNQDNPAALERVVDYLRRVSPGVESVRRTPIGPMETIEFRQAVAGQSKPWSFSATNMSDGTLRGLGVLVALLQANGRPPTLVGLEEPEIALHPAAVGILVDAVRDASLRTQVLLTSHSPDLLDREDLEDDVILAVAAHEGVTTIGPVDDVSRQVLRDRLFTAGEMLRMNQLRPSEDATRTSCAEHLQLFDT